MSPFSTASRKSDATWAIGLLEKSVCVAASPLPLSTDAGAVAGVLLLHPANKAIARTVPKPIRLITAIANLRVRTLDVEKLKTELVTEAELSKAQNIILTQLIYLRDSPFGVVSALGEAEGMADWKDYVDFPNKVQAVTRADLQRVAQQYFIADSRTVGYFVPKN